jgi:hypothetical protein
MNRLPASNVLVSAAELGEVVGIDLETVNNWIRRGIINRSPIGGRQLRNRLFSMEEIYKTALTNELVKLRIPPSPASDAVNALWREWDKETLPGWKLYAVVSLSDEGWAVALCSQKISGGPLRNFGRVAKRTEEMNLPNQAFAMIPVSEVLDRVTKKVSELLSGIKGRAK